MTAFVTIWLEDWSPHFVKDLVLQASAMLFQKLGQWRLPWRLRQGVEDNQITKDALTLTTFIKNPAYPLDLSEILFYRSNRRVVNSVTSELKFERDRIASELELLTRKRSSQSRLPRPENISMAGPAYLR